MAKRSIYLRDAECLYKPCRKVELFDERLRRLLDDMAETMYAAEGAGLAAPQIGILRRAALVDVGDGLVELVNPEIIQMSGEQGGIEGCLSFPGEQGYLVRPNIVVFRAKDRFGKLHAYTAEGFFARAVLHEIDHLDGKVYKRLIVDPPEGFVDDSECDDTETGDDK